MKRTMTITSVLLLVGLVVAGGALVVFWDIDRRDGQVYSVSQTTVSLAQLPKHWVGRTVRVRGVVGGFACLPGCSSSDIPSEATVLSGEYYIRLMDRDPGTILRTNDVYLLVGLQPRGRFLDFLSRLPGLESFIPGQSVAWHGSAVYRLKALHYRVRGRSVSDYEGVLLDTVPGGT